MMCRIYSAILAVMLGLLALPGPAFADITSLTVTPRVKTLAPDRAAAVRLTWLVRTAGSATVQADSGKFFINGVQQDVTSALTPQGRTASGPILFTFNETLTVPLSLVRAAVQQQRPLVYSRVFSSDGFGNEFITRQIQLVFSGGGIDGALEISRLRLSFVNGGTMCNAKPGDNVTVTAHIDTEGTGILRGNWQVRTHGQGGSFRTLKTVRMNVSAGRNLTLQSPPLPMQGNGRIDVRFDITEPNVTFQEPIVTCIIAGVEQPLAAPVASGTPATVIAPEPFTPLDRQTRIEWQPVSGAKAYRIEIRTEADGAPVTGLLVKADRLHTTLSPIVLEKLDPRRRYIVQVYAE